MTSAQVQAVIVQSAQRYGVPAQLAVAVAARESGLQQFDQTGRVKTGMAGELGIFQLLPATASELGVDAADPQENIDGGVRYLRQMFLSFGSWPLAVAAYNCGPGCVSSWLNGARSLPASTIDYVAAITGANLAAPPTSPAAQSALVATTVPSPVSLVVSSPGANSGGEYFYDSNAAAAPPQNSDTAIWIGLGALVLFTAFALSD